MQITLNTLKRKVHHKFVMKLNKENDFVNVFLCNTYYQLVVSLQIQMTIEKNASSILMISNHSKGTEEICEKIKKEHIFREVYYIETKHLCSKRVGTYYRIQALFDGIVGNLFGANIKNCNVKRFYYYNLDFATLAIYAALTRGNKQISPVMMEEGIGSYWGVQFKNKMIRRIEALRKIMGIANLSSSTTSFYCFTPNLYQGCLLPLELPKIEKSDVIIQILRNIFMYKGFSTRIKQKYIFLGTIFDTEGENPIGEHDLVNKVAELVGKDNLIIKTHPRDTSDDYSQRGVDIYKDSTIPWEVMQLVMDMSDKVILTTVSSAAVSLNLMCDDPIKAFMLYKQCNVESNSKAMFCVNMIRALQERGIDLKNHNIYIANKIDDILC